MSVFQLAFLSLFVVSMTPRHTPELPGHLLVLDVSSQNFQDVILKWMHTPAGQQAKGHYTVKMPILDLYDRQGTLLYQGSQAQANAAFIGRIDDMLHSGRQAVAASGPVLSDFLSELPELQKHQADIQKAHLPILFAITFPNKPFCEPQNKALKQLEASELLKRLEIVEIRLY